MILSNHLLNDERKDKTLINRLNRIIPPNNCFKTSETSQ